MASVKQSYHHGGLRDALVTAALDLVEEDGAENFTLKDASKRAGVSVAAPYRHFRDKAELLYHVTGRGFIRLKAETTTARDQHPPASRAGLSAMGRAYVRFAGNYPHLFRLMFSHDGLIEEAEARLLAANDAPDEMEDGFQEFLKTVLAVIEEMGGDREDLMTLAMPLWSLVHGAASLLIDHGFARKAPGTVTDDVISSATEFMFKGYAEDLKSRQA